MTCAEAEPLIGASLDGELDSQTALRIDDHYSTCRRCSVRLARLQRLQQEIAAAELDWSANADLRPLRSAIRRRTRENWWRVPWLWRSAVGAVAAVLMLIMINTGRSGDSIERQMVDQPFAVDAGRSPGRCAELRSAYGEAVVPGEAEFCSLRS